MESFPNSPAGGIQQNLPNATSVLVLGILSIVLCCCYGIAGCILSIIAIILAGRDTRLFTSRPGVYTESSYRNLRSGRICAIIGLCLGVLYLLVLIAIAALFGISALLHPQVLQQKLMELQQN